MSIQVEIEFGAEISSPSLEDLRSWALAALSASYSEAELCIRIVDTAEMSQLNQNYRNKPNPTNVLSFPADVPEQIGMNLLGDIAICAEVVEREATEQNKASDAHWAHMVIHGCLHLAGYDHIEEQDALNMEALETGILAKLGFPAPYEPAEELQHPQPAVSH